jgi:hypothetical protein
VGGNMRALKLPQTQDIREKYKSVGWYVEEIDSEVEKDERLYPGDSFLKRASEEKKIERKKSFGIGEKIEEVEVKKLGAFKIDSMEECKQKVIVEKEMPLEKKEVRTFNIRRGDSSKLERVTGKGYYIDGGEAQKERLGLGIVNAKIEETVSTSKYSYKNVISMNGMKTEPKSSGLKGTVKKIAEGSKTAISGFVTKFISKK